MYVVSARSPLQVALAHAVFFVAGEAGPAVYVGDALVKTERDGLEFDFGFEVGLVLDVVLVLDFVVEHLRDGEQFTPGSEEVTEVHV